MKQISKISLIGIGVGSFVSVYSFLRYYLGLMGGYVDVDKSAIYILVGFLVISISYLYERLKQAEFKIDSMGEYLADKK